MSCFCKRQSACDTQHHMLCQSSDMQKSATKVAAYSCMNIAESRPDKPFRNKA